MFPGLARAGDVSPVWEGRGCINTLYLPVSPLHDNMHTAMCGYSAAPVLCHHRSRCEELLLPISLVVVVLLLLPCPALFPSARPPRAPCLSCC